MYQSLKGSVYQCIKHFTLGYWDTDMRPYLEGQVSTLLRRGARSPAIFFYPRSRLLNYLSLVRDGTYASGLTVYCSKAGLHGMRVHFPTGSTMFGERNGYNLHFAPAKGEYLTSVWVNSRCKFKKKGLPQLRGSEMILAVSKVYIPAPLTDIGN